MVQTFLMQRGEEDTEIVELKAVAANNFVLAQYKRTEPADHVYPMRQLVRFADKDLITLEMTKDFQSVKRALNKLYLEFIASSLILAVLLGTTLWYILRKMALMPMEDEIRKRRKAEAALQRLSHQNKLILESIAEGIYGFDLQGNITFVNPAAVKLTGWEAEELMGRPQHDILHHSRSDGTRYPSKECQVCAALKDGAVHHVTDEIFWKKDGTSFPVEYISTPLLEEEGIVGGVVTFQDISERKRIQERQTQLLEELEDTNRELKDFAYIVSHDLKAPLRAINSLASWLSTDYSDRLDEDGKEQLALLMGRTKRMNDLIDGILQYSRIGRIRQEKVGVDLNDVVEHVLDLIAVPEHIDVKVASKLPTVVCEKTRIEEVFQNLISNAVKFLDKPKGEIKIGCTEEGGYWKCSVKDNGPGIDEKYFKKIFQIFQTLSPRDKFESTGVGLTIVEKIIRMYGGKIWVESQAGQGSTFFFTLPKQQRFKSIRSEDKK